jgi:RNA polymerase sigma-70 factor (ECF subfamily)
MTESQGAESIAGLDPANWLDKHGDYLYRCALRRLREPQVAEDLVQETFLAAFQARERFAHASSERTWLVGILKHKIIDHLRKKHREQPLSNFGPTDSVLDDWFDSRGHWKKSVKPAPSPGAAFERQEFWNVLSGCLGKLPEHLAHAFVLREMDEQNTGEICKALDITPTNLWVMLHRARLRLWRCLEIRWFGGEKTRTETTPTGTTPTEGTRT